MPKPPQQRRWWRSVFKPGPFRVSICEQGIRRKAWMDTRGDSRSCAHRRLPRAASICGQLDGPVACEHVHWHSFLMGCRCNCWGIHRQLPRDYFFYHWDQRLQVLDYCICHSNYSSKVSAIPPILEARVKSSDDVRILSGKVRNIAAIEVIC